MNECRDRFVANICRLGEGSAGLDRGLPIQEKARLDGRFGKIDIYAPPVNVIEESVISERRPPLPPFTYATAVAKVRAAEDGWNTRDPARIALAYTETTEWRNRDEFVTGRMDVIAFLTRKWRREHEYRLVKELWAFTSDRIAVRFAYECCDDAGIWYRSYGNENWEFDRNGLMSRRFASINDLRIEPAERLFYWAAPGPRPVDHANLTELGL